MKHNSPLRLPFALKQFNTYILLLLLLCFAANNGLAQERKKIEIKDNTLESLKIISNKKLGILIVRNKHILSLTIMIKHH